MILGYSKQFVLIVLASLLASCATPGGNLDESVGSIRTGLASAETETESVFALANKRARDTTIRRLVLSESRPSEAEFASVIDAETLAKWSAGFDALDAYLAGLQKLVSDGPSQSVTDDLNAIGSTLQSETIGATLPDGSAGLFANLGGALLQARAENEAQAIMLRTDREFSNLTRGMADLIYPPTMAQRRGTIFNMVRTHWDNQLGGIINEYNQVANDGPDKRRPVIESFASAIDQREADFQRLRRLRQALIALGEAHRTASTRNSSGTLFWLAQVEKQLDEARKEANGGS